ncbi:probable aquaporin SIP2-1 [Olea europaea var. sylvestris]|uniref:Probable aquaporin SIP2-1 n=1 Tax=Olea europaea subsp. europaea TaxID=158383 RepID=A0A8S0VLL3_OLEEU|nr:probable aquaporin SIP2-1 [Olea europaea var. sylvestris]CAA3030814.1 probable aquaporin SIP2-1 [Olea europaea subsp. europaea]CAA3030815.1 probable aquaporin SIP2-1 [Olea europaea subsp. europaea]
MAAVRGRRLLVSDFLMSFMWVWSSVLIKIFVYKILDYGSHDMKGEILRYGISIVNMFFFAFLAKATKGGAYNPLTVLSSAISGNFSNFLFTVGARIPVQVLGSIYGVRLILAAFPEIGRGPRLNVDITRGALTEGFLTFGIVIISQGLSRKLPGSFFMKTWISSVSKLTLHMLGSDLTGGCMNPASVMGWAFTRGEHISKEHLIVYWLAPMEATLAAVWAFRVVVRPENDKTPKVKSGKSE